MDKNTETTLEVIEPTVDVVFEKTPEGDSKEIETTVKVEGNKKTTIIVETVKPKDDLIEEYDKKIAKNRDQIAFSQKIIDKNENQIKDIQIKIDALEKEITDLEERKLKAVE